MKSQMAPLLLCLAWSLLQPCIAARRVVMLDGRPRAVTEVVKMLQEMLDKSKEDGDADREIFAKLQCYCNTNEQSKTEEIEALTKDIDMLENKIGELMGSTGGLSSQCAKLKADMAANEDARMTAQTQRDEEAGTYGDLKSDLDTAVGQLNSAIDTLADVGGDQTLENAIGADSVKFMGGYGTDLIKLQSRVKEALVAASTFLRPKQVHVVNSFLQAPFTGTYTAQSGEVVGILKDMRDTFKTNLAEATMKEDKAIESFDKFMDAKRTAFQDMKDMYEEKQAEMGTNDDDLSTKQEQLSTAKSDRQTRQDFLAELLPMCEAKTKEYAARKTLRANEDAAISEAIAILDKDSAFELFGKVSATSTGSTGPEFLQVRSSHERDPKTARAVALQLLQAARKASSDVSSHLVKVAALLQADNPFDIVLAEIEKMIDLIQAEADNDLKQKTWCEDENSRTKKTIFDAGTEITELSNAITTLEGEIDAPETGLKSQIASTEQGLADNEKSQKEETAMRTKDNLAYQANVANIVKAEELLQNAINVLTNYYDERAKVDKEEEESVETLTGESSARPSTWESEKGYKGQSNKGANVINMLQYILDESKKEEETAHKDEESSQGSYEDSMTELKSGESDLQKSLAELQQTLAEKEQELLEQKENKKKTQGEKKAAEDYLAEIKPGCDFMIDNFDKRETRRSEEKAALRTARGLLKGTPIYQSFEAQREVEALGPCADICSENKEHVKCKACLADVTVPGYCAGHKGTEGC